VISFSATWFIVKVVVGSGTGTVTSTFATWSIYKVVGSETGDITASSTK